MKQIQKVFFFATTLLFMEQGLTYGAYKNSNDAIFSINGTSSEYWATVGDAGNQADVSGFGSVAYTYSIGKYEITNAQYATFLTTVAGASDPHSLYNTNMSITKSGTTYTAATGYEDKPLIYQSWYSALRFINWLNSGTTESGAYDLSNNYANLYDIEGNIIRQEEAAYWLPSENEWYKAAYYKGDGTDAGYWLYPTQSDSITTADANFGGFVGSFTDVGTYDDISYYGTYDQAGNVWEWNDTDINGNRGVRGGAWNNNASTLESSFQGYNYLSGGYNIGFRLAGIEGLANAPSVPEPASIGLVLISLTGLACRRIKIHSRP